MHLLTQRRHHHHTSDPEGYLGVAYSHAAVLVAEAVKELKLIHEREMDNMRQAFRREMDDMRQAFRREMDDMREAYDSELKALKSDVEGLGRDKL